MTAPRLPLPPGLRWAIWIGLLLAWSVALLLPIPQGAARVGTPEQLFTFSKLLHIAAYAFLAAFVARLPASKTCRWGLIVVLFVHASLSEYGQSMLATGRSGSVRDVLLDQLGILLGLGYTWRSWFTA